MKLSKNRKAGMLSNKVVQIALALIFLVILGLIIRNLLWGSEASIKEVMACNNPQQKCACLLWPEDMQTSGGPTLECPEGLIQSEFDSGCPKSCTKENFKKNLEDATKGFKDSSDQNEMDYFGHCCRGPVDEYDLS